MKRIEKGVEPPRLATFRSQKPDATWEVFKKTRRKAYAELVKEMYKRQQGLCAYCEINLLMGHQDPLDRCVDHFHPKSDHQDEKNWGLAYDNLFLSCFGGREKELSKDDKRYSEPVKENLSCDAKKADRVLDGAILNPFMVPKAPMIFSIIVASGAIAPNADNCHAAGIKVQRVQQTIEELGLNCKRLQLARKETWDCLKAEVLKRLEMGESLSPLIQTYLAPDQNNRLTPFFSTIRAFFGKKE